MSDDQRKLMYSKKGTGTVPKIKHRNNTSYSNQEERYPNVLSNNLGTDTQRPDYSRQLRNSARNLQYTGFSPMDSTLDQNGLRLNTSNGTSTPNSRRNSVGTVPKCDNISKYPDKKQIEAKLTQIREYLRVTSSLMMNMKNTDEHSNEEDGCGDREHLEVMITDLLDSEAKLVVLLEEIESDSDDPNVLDSEVLIEEIDTESLEDEVRNELPESTFEPVIEEPATSNLKLQLELQAREIKKLKDQENFLLDLQLAGESQMREARIAQEKLARAHIHNTNHIELTNGYNDSMETVSNSGVSNKNLNEMTQDGLREFEDRWKSVENGINRNPLTDQTQMDSIQSRIMQMREGNDNRTQLIHMLDNRDMQLQAEHNALQSKLQELQNKKMQVDELVLQLETMNEESEDEEVGNQVKKIVTMKQHLAKLKDMLNMVATTEVAIESQNINESEVEDHVRRLCTKTENLMQNDVRTNRAQIVDNNTASAALRLENNTAHASNERRVKEKQVNKKSMNANERERSKLQAELQAKRRELEELMCKHKAATSNLNQDVNNENKSDLGQTSNPQFDGARNLYSPNSSGFYNVPNSSDGFSSECPEDDMNEYSEINSSTDVQPMPVLSYPTTNYIQNKRREPEPRLDIPNEQFVQVCRTPDRSVRSASITTPNFTQRERARTNSNNDLSNNKNQMQKQLELIRSVCDSMLDQTHNQPANVQVRNNLTPSPIYSEPRQYASNAHSMNALNIVNPPTDPQFHPPMQGFTPADAGNYQNWLTNNSLQTQAFMLNTLNQCCQMLWLQQRELTTLKSTVNMMQERYQPESFENTQQNNPMSQYMNTNPCLFPPNPNIPTTNNAAAAHHSNTQYRPSNNPPTKMNPNTVAGATSMPNLNQQQQQPQPSHCSQTNMEHAYANHCNLQNARVLDSALNNTNVLNSNVLNHQNLIGEQHNANNSVLHNQALPSQIWNGQALNNQVAPGNRANNYWDNFRSYSRQNLLSTKSNELLQNTSTTTERSNNSSERTQQRAPLQRTNSSSSQTVPKLNRENHEASTNTSAENRRPPVVRQSGTIPPDVLNVNQIHQSKSNESQTGLEFAMEAQVVDNAEAVANAVFQPFLNGYTNENAFNPVQDVGHARNMNEWHDEATVDNNSVKSKLFEELRENVYKEVASLISANQARPHFLIQLFRDLQLISSDPLRRRTLQSIQSVITHSLETPTPSNGAIRQMATLPIEQNDISEENLLSATDFFMAPYCWPTAPRNKPLVNENGIIDTNGEVHLSEVLAFLNAHSEDIFSDSLVHSLRDLLVESTFSAIFATTNTKDGIIQKHFASLLTEALEQYRGKKVQDVRLNVLQTVEDLLRGEISLIRLMRENISDDMHSVDSNTTPPVQSFDLQLPINDDDVPQIQNADLAEADQSRIELDEDDEGAVGGVLNILLERSSSSNAGQILNEETDLPKLDLVLSTESDIEYVDVEGLDQVPTRLANPSSRSNTPNKDLSNTRLEDHF